MHILIVLGIVAAVVWFFWDRGNHLFRIDVVQGRIEMTDGRAPGPLLETLRHIIQQSGVQQATIKGVKAQNGATLRCSGLSEGQEQRLRNAFRLSPQAKFRAGENPVNERNMWRALSLSALLSYFFRR